MAPAWDASRPSGEHRLQRPWRAPHSGPAAGRAAFGRTSVPIHSQIASKLRLLEGLTSFETATADPAERAELDETPVGGTAMVHLGVRPVGPARACSPLGQETFLT